MDLFLPQERISRFESIKKANLSEVPSYHYRLILTKVPTILRNIDNACPSVIPRSIPRSSRQKVLACHFDYANQ